MNYDLEVKLYNKCLREGKKSQAEVHRQNCLALDEAARSPRELAAAARRKLTHAALRRDAARDADAVAAARAKAWRPASDSFVADKAKKLDEGQRPGRAADQPAAA